jgi:hypothetical protein
MEKAKALMVWSKNYETLAKKWLATLPDCFEPLVKEIIVSDGECGMHTPSWYEAITQRIAHNLDFMQKSPEGAIFLSSDADIFFLKNSHELVDLAKDAIIKRSADLLIMPEGYKKEEINSGLYFMKNSPRTRAFLDGAKEYVRKKSLYADQDFFNMELFKKDPALKWERIPRAKVGWGSVIESPKEALFHHAVCCTNVDSAPPWIADKLRQQSLVEELLQKTT